MTLCIPCVNHFNNVLVRASGEEMMIEGFGPLSIEFSLPVMQLCRREFGGKRAGGSATS